MRGMHEDKRASGPTCTAVSSFRSTTIGMPCSREGTHQA